MSASAVPRKGVRMLPRERGGGVRLVRDRVWSVMMEDPPRELGQTGSATPGSVSVRWARVVMCRGKYNASCQHTHTHIHIHMPRGI